MRRLLVVFALMTACSDAGAPTVGVARRGLTIYPRVGNAADATPPLHGPALVLMGGGPDVDAAFQRVYDVVGAGDVVVLRATGTNAYDDYLHGLAAFNSVQTLLVSNPASAGDLAQAAAIVDKAEAVFFAGGNQADYVAWKGSPLMKSVAALYARGGAVGGTSAGCAILGQYVYDATAAGSNVMSADALANPYEPAITFTRDLFAFAPLAGVITDPHFAQRDRFGRLATFMARQVADGAATSVVGIAVDEGNALVVDAAGVATLTQQQAGAARIVRGGAATTVKAGTPLVYGPLAVTRLDVAGQRYDLVHDCGQGTRYSVSVDGNAAPPYAPADPYAAAGSAVAACADAPDLGGGSDMAAPGDMADAPVDAGVPADGGAGAGDAGGGGRPPHSGCSVVF